MQCDDPWRGQQMRADRGRVDAFRYGGEGEADGALHQPPGTEDDDGGDAQAYRRIEPEPTGEPDSDPDSDDGSGNEGVGRHMQECALQIEVARAPGSEQQGRDSVDQDARGG